MHIELDDQLVARVDRIAGARGRSAFVRRAVETAIEQATRWEALEAAAGSISDSDHEWDDNPAAWVRAQRHSDARRAG